MRQHPSALRSMCVSEASVRGHWQKGTVPFSEKFILSEQKMKTYIF